MANHSRKIILLIIIMALSPLIVSAMDCAPDGEVVQVCTEIKEDQYNTTSPEIRVQFFESGVHTYNPKIYRIGDLGSEYPENPLEIKNGVYDEIEVDVSRQDENIYTPKLYVADGIYMFRIDAVNLPRNIRNVSVFFSINTTGMKFWVTSPRNNVLAVDSHVKFAVSNNEMFLLDMQAERPVELCKFSPSREGGGSYEDVFDRMLYNFTTSTAKEGYFFTVFNISEYYPNKQEGKIYPLSIICKEPNGRYSYDIIYVGYDNSSPIVTLSAIPNPVKDASDASTNLTIKTNDRSACTIKKLQDTPKPYIIRNEGYEFTKLDEFVTEYSERLQFSGAMNQNNYTYLINCTNLVGLYTQVNKTISLEMKDTQMFEFTSPPDFTNSKTILVNGSAILGGATVCTATMNKSGTFTKLTQESIYSGNIYSGTLTSTLPEGKQTVYVNCTLMYDYFSSKTFVVDTVPPSAPNITAGPNSCSLKEITARFKSTDNNSGIKKYYYNFTVSGEFIDESIEKSTTKGDITYPIDGEIVEGETYTLKAWAEDKAGNKGSPSVASIIITNNSITACDSVPPRIYANLTKNNEANTWTIRINCSDSQSGCKQTFLYGMETNASKGCNATSSANLMTPIVVSSTTNFCAKVMDNNNNENTFQKEITINYPLTCRDGVKNGRETDTDCGGDCPKCTLNKTCSVNGDCSANFCLNKKCVMPSCTDKVKNGNESGMDCGGPCAGCDIGVTCNTDGDCKSENCNNGRCEEPSCTNSKKDGSESDVDCGGTCKLCLRGDLCKSLLDCSTKYCDSTSDTCQIKPDLDSDNDGLPDVWEERYCSSFTGCDPKGDLDGDGYTNLEEFTAQTNPLDKDSFPDYKKYNIFSIIFLILGVLLVIGGGAIKVMEVLEEQKREKAREEMEMRSTLGQIPKMNSLAPADIPKLRELTEEEKIRGQQARIKALKSRDAERRKIINQFDSDEEKPQSVAEQTKPTVPFEKKIEPVQEPVSQAEKPASKKKTTSLDASAKDGYVDLTDLNKKKEDAFSKLKNIAESKPDYASRQKTDSSRQNISRRNAGPEMKSASPKVPVKTASKAANDEVFEKLKSITAKKAKANK